MLLKHLNIEGEHQVLDYISVYCFLLSLFFLPLNMWLNNLMVLLFISTQLISFFMRFKAKVSGIQENKKLLFIITSPFLLTLIGLTYSNNLDNAADDVVRLLPVLVIPILFSTNQKLFKEIVFKSGVFMTLGCVIAALICWTYNMSIIINNGESLKRLFSPVYANQGLTKVIDIHASYMAILINTSIAFLVYMISKAKTKRQKWIIYISIFILTIFLFHLLARTALIVFLLSVFVYLILKRKWVMLIIAGSFLALTVIIINSVDKNYLRDRLFNNLNFFEKQKQFSKKDDRFNRLKASYEVFLMYPILGPGTADEDELRREIFKRNRDIVAYNENYNAHNQFFEYLSTYGIIGGAVFIILFISIFTIVIRKKNGFFLFIFSMFFLCCMTESLLERTLGITYFAVCVSFLILLNNNHLNSAK